MAALFLYTLKSAFVLALLYVPYTLLLSRETFFRFNRWMLLGILGLSLLLTFVQTLQWWNPLCYMLGTSLRDVHEYEADDYVLRQGIALSCYQHLLIKKAVGSSSYAFANNFNHSLIKKRITMMCKKHSNPWMRSKSLIAFPMVALALCAFATPRFVQPVEQAVNQFSGKVTETTPTGQVSVPESTETMTATPTSVVVDQVMVK